MQSKYMSLLGLARRAGRLAHGHDTALESVQKNKAKLILFSSDASERLKREFTREAERRSIPCRGLNETMDEIHFSLGCRAGVLAVNDIHFASRLIQLLEQEENAYGD